MEPKVVSPVVAERAATIPPIAAEEEAAVEVLVEEAAVEVLEAVAAAAGSSGDDEGTIEEAKEQYSDMLRMITERQAKINRALEQDEAQLHARQDRMDGALSAADSDFFQARAAAAHRPDLAAGVPTASFPPPTTSTWQGLNEMVASRGLPELVFSAPGSGASGESVLRLVRDLTARLDKSNFERTRAVESVSFSQQRGYGGGSSGGLDSSMLDISLNDASFTSDARDDDAAGRGNDLLDEDDPIFFNGPQLRRRLREVLLANRKLRNRSELRKAEAEREAASRVKVAKRCRKLEETLSKMQQLLRHAKNRGNAKESELTRLRNHLSAQVRGEQQRAARLSKTIRESAKKGGGGGGADAVASAYEQQRLQMQDEIAQLRGENTRLLASLSARENARAAALGGGGGDVPAASTPATPSTAPSKADGAAGATLDARLETRRRARMQTLMDDLGRLETRLSETTLKCSRLTEDNATLRTDMRERPTALELAAAQRAVRGLEEELARRIATPPRAVLAPRVAPQHRKKPSPAAMPIESTRRSKQPQTARLSPPAARALLGAICKTLRKSDPHEVPGTVAKLLRAAESLPRLQGFARDVCAVVSAERISARARGDMSATVELASEGSRSDAIIKTLVAWRGKLASAHAAYTFRDDCAASVARRVGGDEAGGYVVTSNEAILNAVEELVQREAAAESTSRMYKKGEALLAVRCVPHHLLPTLSLKRWFLQD